MSPEKFRAALRRHMQASPFTGALVYLRGSSRITLTGCLVDEDTNKIEVEEYGATPQHVLSLHIDKAALTLTPNQDKDRIEYKGRVYRFTLTAGRDDVSPVWCLDCRSPRT